jgi:hypothetical protein
VPDGCIPDGPESDGVPRGSREKCKIDALAHPHLNPGAALTAKPHEVVENFTSALSPDTAQRRRPKVNLSKKFLNRPGASAVYLWVETMDR